MKNRAAFLDRDGVLNVDHDYVFRLEDWEWIPGAKEALQRLRDEGYLGVVVTNQSGIARGLFTISDFQNLTTWVESQANGAIRKTYYCPHHPDFGFDCDCRKPKPGLLLQAIDELSIDAKSSFLIGDSQRDLQAAQSAGVSGYRFFGGNLDEFVMRVLKKEKLRCESAELLP